MGACWNTKCEYINWMGQCTLTACKHPESHWGMTSNKTYGTAEVFRLIKKILPEKQRPCEYCHMVNRNKGIAESLREALKGKDDGKRIEYPFMSIQIIDNSGRGISSKGFTAKFCPNCGRELET